MAFFSSAASLGSSMRFTARSSSGRRFFSAAASSSAIAFMSGSAGHRLGVLQLALGLAPFADRLDQRPEIGIFLRGRDELLRIERAARQAACSSAWRAAIWSSFCSSDTSTSDLQRASARASSATSRCSPLSRSLSCATPLASSSSPMISDGAGVELVGALHAPLHVAAIVLLDGDARRGAARGRCPAPWPRPPRRAARSRRAAARRRARCSSITSRSMPPAQPMPARRRAAHARRSARRSGRRPAPCPARRDASVDELEGGVGVVVEAAHQARDRPRTAMPSASRPVLHRREEVRGSPAFRWSAKDRRVGDDRLVALVLAVEDAQRIALQALAAVLGQLVDVAGVVVDQRLAIGRRGSRGRPAC